MKKMKITVTATLIFAIIVFASSCKKENSNDASDSNKPTSLSAANHNVVNQPAFSPWQIVSSGVSVSQRGIIDMSASDQTTCYGIVIDENDFLGDPLHDITITDDGGKSWHSQTIPGLENNYLFGVAATTGNTAHVFGFNYANGGGNVFRSKDGGNTWQREAANAYTDPASFPDVIKFFDAQNGVIFGDPENGYFEIYTTSDGGNSWTRVPSSQIPTPKPIEQGITFFADTYLNTVWMITVTRESATGGITGARLMQSDDRGHHWYVRNPSIPFNSSGDNLLRFRNRSVGLYKENAILYRTTDGGTTWNEVNYSGTWFSHGIDNVPGKEGLWISTGAIDNFYPTNSAKGIGSSISYDDGDHWITLDTAVNHTCVEITNPARGYSGGITTGSGNDGAFIYSFPPAHLP